MPLVKCFKKISGKLHAIVNSLVAYHLAKSCLKWGPLKRMRVFCRVHALLDFPGS